MDTLDLYALDLDCDEVQRQLAVLTDYAVGPGNSFSAAIQAVICNRKSPEQLSDLTERLGAKLFAEDGLQNGEEYRWQWRFFIAMAQQIAAARQVGDTKEKLEDARQHLSELVEKYSEHLAKRSVANEDPDTVSEIDRRRLKGSTWEFAALSSESIADYVKHAVQRLDSHEAVRATACIERTTILFAVGQTGCAIRLVAELVANDGSPGSQWIMPDWMKLGLAHLGPNLELCESIQRAMSCVAPNVSILWWLEAGNGYQWPGRLSDSESATVAAACVAKALAENTSKFRPLLDDAVAVSGLLVKDSDGKLWCGAVTGVIQKINGLTEENPVRRIVLSVEVDVRQHEFSGKKVVVRESFDEAYQTLLRCSEFFLAYKHKSVCDWDKGIVEIGPNAQVCYSPLSACVEQSKERKKFLLNQPIWKYKGVWTSATSERDLSIGQESWMAIGREELTLCALSRDWRNVGLLGSAGIGKSINLQYIASAVNRLEKGCDAHMAIHLDASELPICNDFTKVIDIVASRLIASVGQLKVLQGGNELQLRELSNWLYSTGRILFLIDNVTNDKVVWKKLAHLLDQECNCKVWIAGYPSAFTHLSQYLKIDLSRWKFVRIGPLTEVESRELLSTWTPPIRD